MDWPAGGCRVPTRFQRPARNSRRAANGSRQVVVAVTAIGTVLAFAAVATDRFVAAVNRPALMAVQALDDDIYTGSILYMPDTSNVCHQWLFDNQTGLVTDNGSVDCANAAYQGLDGPKQWSAARMRIIATGFRDH
jgi:hypothetical protein